MNRDFSIAIIGLGYVGLPLALAFSKHFAVTGYDSNPDRIRDLQQGHDATGEADLSLLVNNSNLTLSNEIAAMASCRVFIITVPTPIDQFKSPDLGPLLSASATVGSLLKKGDLVIYESTVYPGCTEEDCVPVLEKSSGLRFNHEFFCGYSPERINPGDKVNTLTRIKKITSGSTPEIAAFTDELYRTIIEAGTHAAPSIKVAEAAKAIENAQRDINISFANELALIFDRMGIDTQEVLAAASTKWNFLPFKPGLVGGHCIGVDPYYLAHKAQLLGYHPQVILSGRQVNDSMGRFVAQKLIKLLIAKGNLILGARVLLMGITFKENCPDIRNSKVFDIIEELRDFGVQVDVYDPVANLSGISFESPARLVNNPEGSYDGIITAVAHQLFSELDIKALLKGPGSVLFDLKGIYPRELSDARL